MREQLEPGVTSVPDHAPVNDGDVVKDAREQSARAQEVRDAARTWRSIVRRRVAAAAIVIALWAVGIEARLVYLQVYQHDDFVARAERQSNRTVNLLPRRGEMLDRNGRVLAYTVDGDVIFAEPTLLKDPEDVTRRVCAALEHCDDAERRQMLDRVNRKRSFAYLRRIASPADAERVMALGIRGVGVHKEPRRYYPHGSLAAHVLGYVGIDGQALGGVEVTNDRTIKGQPGLMLLQTDAKGNAFGRLQQPPSIGDAVELTIDTYLQYVCERELAAGVKEFNAQGGSAIIMQPHTGDVLALCNVPTFNPNDYTSSSDDARRNRSVQDVYEPGSTFKTVTASAALEERIVGLDDVFDASPGYIRIGSRTIDDVHRYGLLTFREGIIKSSNVVAVKAGLRIGADRLGKYVRRYGFGQKHLRDLPGESSGIVWDPAKWTDSALASVSMGYQIGVTPVQMATAVNAIASGGELIDPRLVRATFHDGARKENPSTVIRRAVSADTAATLTGVMEQVVEEGTAKAARIEGFTIAGKTGTAAKLENGRYSKTDYNGSFVGFLPSRDPAVTVLVVIDSPKGKGYYGGTVAAPVFKRIAEAAMTHLGIGPNLTPVDRVVVPAPAPEGEPGLTRATGRPTSVLAVRAGQSAAAGLMPDLRGMSAREAARTLATLGLVTHMSGHGLVVSQDIPAGTPVERGSACTVALERRPVAAVADDSR